MLPTFLRLFETAVVLYCVLSYVGCFIVLYVNWAKQGELFNKTVTKGERVVAAIVFLVLAPIMVADVIVHRLKHGPGAE